jgi:isoleucyl-tRNA synthetase
MRSLPKSWSSTLSLPKSRFPARPLVSDRSRYLEQCSDELYKWQRNRGSLELFTLQDGPPYANGSLHIGHALNKILKDITCRFQITQGKRVQYVPGWDCHGLPIELKALQKQRGLGIIGHHEHPGPVALRTAARELAVQTVEEQKRSFRDWGIMADWEHAWRTMDKGFEIQQLKVFEKLVHQGLIYRRFKPVYWSPSTKTALAEAELEYNENHISTAVFVKYRMHSLPQELGTKLGIDANDIHALIWTTTPWTLPANKAIGINSDIEYSIVESESHGFLLLASSRVEEVQKLLKQSLALRLKFQGFELSGATYHDMTFNDISSPRPLLHAAFVSAGSGSGLVHLAPGHGMDDYELCTKHGIPAFAPLDDDGRFTALAAPKYPDRLLGKEVLTLGTGALLEIIAENNILLGRHKYKHKYPYDWRSKQPVIVRATEQWFANVGELRKAALRSLDAVTFIPASGGERLRSFIRNRSEWCISRQRAWGVPIPALYHKITGEALMSKDSVSHIISVIEQRGTNSWWTDNELDPSWTPPWLRNENGQTSYVRGKDTMDVWFDSGTSWTQTKTTTSQKASPAADVYLEGTDQHRGWFQSSLLTYIALQKGDTSKLVPTAPFKQLITHGFTLDQHGRKMSKSLGNVISPDEIMEGTLLPSLKRKQKGQEENVLAGLEVMHDSMGPDALRLWVASCDFTKDVIISQAVLKAINGSLSKYRVTFKLLLGILEDFSPSKPIHFRQLNINHQMALMQLRGLQIVVQKLYQTYEYNKAINEINKYIVDLSAFYIESVKDAAYAGRDEVYSISSREMTQYTLLHIFTAFQQMLAPVTPLLIEETWDYTPTKIQEWHGYPFHRQWTEEPEIDENDDDRWHNEQLEKDFPILMQANAAIKSAQEMARKDKKMGSSLQSFVLIEVKQLSTTQPAKHLETMVFRIFNRYLADLEAIFVVSKIDISLGSLPSLVQDAAWSYVTKFDVKGAEVWAHIYAPRKAKCVRCWRYAAPVEVMDQNPLCERCNVVIKNLRAEKPELFDKEPVDSCY